MIRCRRLRCFSFAKYDEEPHQEGDCPMKSLESTVSASPQSVSVGGAFTAGQVFAGLLKLESSWKDSLQWLR